MKKLISLTCTIALLLAFVGAASAYNNQVHVTQAHNGKGDVLIFPAYFVDQGNLSTKFTVVNTSENESSVAKVIVRSMKDSQELLDFLIYLSPRDEWQGTLKYDAAKDDLVMYSEDDSVLRITGEAQAKFASEDNPMNVRVPAPPVDVTLQDNDSKWVGYVEVINGWASGDQFADYNEDGVIVPRDLSTNIEKKYIKKAYENPGVLLTADDPFDDFDGHVMNGFQYYWDCDEDTNVNDCCVNDKDILSGWAELKMINFATAKLQATVFQNFGIRSNRNLQIEDSTTLWNVDSINTIGELEAAFSKLNIALPFSNNDEALSLHLMTYPTKSCVLGRNPVTAEYEVRAVYSPFFTIWGDPAHDFRLTYPNDHPRAGKLMPFLHVFDLMENNQEIESIFSPLNIDDPYELFFLLTEDNDATSQVEFPFEEGWVEYDYINWLIATPTQAYIDSIDYIDPQLPINNPICYPQAKKWVIYQGAPAIPTTVTIDQTGLNWTYGTYDKGIAADPEFSSSKVYETTVRLIENDYAVDEVNDILKIYNPTKDWDGDGTTIDGYDTIEGQEVPYEALDLF